MSKAAELANLIGNINAGGGGANRNLIINGGMTVAQRSDGTVTVSDGSNEGYATVDRFGLRFNATAGGACEMSQSTDTPDGFANSVKIKCSTTDSAHTGTQSVYLDQRIEAQNLQLLGYGSSGAKQMTISWYMKTVSYTDPISLAFEVRDGTAEYYVKSYTPTTSWARYTCTLPASTSATINNDSGDGMHVKFVFAGSSSGTYAASSDSTAWSTTRADYRNDIGNFVASTSNEIYITGVQLEIGQNPTEFEHEPFERTLHKCQRYYFRKNADADKYTTMCGGYIYSSTNGHFRMDLPTTMRALPTIATSGTFRLVAPNADNLTSFALNHGSPDSVSFDCGVSGGHGESTGNGGLITASNDADAYIEVKAEL